MAIEEHDASVQDPNDSMKDVTEPPYLSRGESPRPSTPAAATIPAIDQEANTQEIEQHKNKEEEKERGDGSVVYAENAENSENSANPPVQPDQTENAGVIESESGSHKDQAAESHPKQPPDVSEVSETPSTTVSQSVTPEPEDLPKKAKRLTLQERLALAAKKKKAQKEGMKNSGISVGNDGSASVEKAEISDSKVVIGSENGPENKPETEAENGAENPQNLCPESRDFERQIKQLRQKLQEAEKEVARSAKAERDAARSTKSEPETKKTEELEKKVADKDQVISQLMQEGQELSKKELKLNEKIKSLVASNTKLEASLRTYAEKNQEALLKLGEVEDYLQKHKFKNIEQFMGHVTDLKEKVSVLETSLAKEQKEEWQSKYKEQEKLYTKEVQQRKAIENKLSEALLQIDLARNQHKLEIQSKDDIIASLNREISQVKGENASELSRLETKIELLRSENENFLKFSQGPKSDPEISKEDSSNDADYIKLSENHSNLQAQYLSSQENWKTIEINLLGKIESLQQSVQSYQAAKQKTSAELKRLHGKMNVQDDQLVKLANDNAKLSESLKEAEFQLKMKVNELSDLEAKFEEVTTIFNSDRSNYDMKIDTLGQEIKALTAQIEAVDTNNGAFGLSNNRKFKEGGLFIDMKPPLRGNQSSFASIPNSSSGNIAAQQLTWDEPYQSRNNSISERNDRNYDRNYERNSIYERNSVYEDRNVSSQSLEIYPCEAPDASNSVINSGIPSSAGATKNIQIISKMSSTVRRLETEIMTLKEENEQLVTQKDAAQREILDRSDLVQKISDLETEVSSLKASLAEKEKNEETLLEVIGEKSERVEELKADVDDLKDLMRQQVQQMIEMQGK